MTPEILHTFISQDLTALMVKVLVVILLLLYTVFSAIMVRQVQTMNKVLNIANFSPILFFTAMIHLLAAIGLLVVALLVL